MNYQLNIKDQQTRRESPLIALRRLVPLIQGEQRNIAIAVVAILLTSSSTLVAPVIIAHTVDTYISHGDYAGVLMWTGILLCVFLVGLGSSYIQTRTMGGVGRRILFNMRNAIFTKLQDLPVAFFNQNKSGDLISRINNDTDKLNQFFAQALMQFVSNGFLILGAGILLLVLNIRLGAAALLPAVVVLVITQLISPWVKRASFKSLQTLGGLSGEIQESLTNFKVIVAFNRLDYFRNKFNQANTANFTASVRAGIASNVFLPIYGLAYNFGQMIVLAYGILMISSGQLTTGLLIGFLLYVNNFYNPLRQLATVWSSLQLALAAFDRISEVLALETDMKIVPAKPTGSTAVLEFKDVSFSYPDGKQVLSHVEFALERGKTYALVGPTGGGKTTTASLMARLYDPTSGTVLLDGTDIRSYAPEARAQKIGFILQEPFLFTGTVRDNILYGNSAYRDLTDAQLEALLAEANLAGLLTRFDRGLETPVTSSGDSISLGQKQLIAFIRAVLRNPDLLILDEATANIDTVTEQLLEDILTKLPATTTKVIIAHRLNTIDNADEIFFVNAGTIIRAGSMEHAVDMLLHGKMQS
ncbi:MAG: multidrug transporter [Hyphomicrobiales bacterium]|nr:multidrug transporter [Hyphomicrobiales bacterium]